MLKSIPDPVKLTICGLFAAESVNVTVPVREPEAVAENVTCRVQVALAATEVQLLLTTAKSPLARTWLMVSGLLPVLVTVIVCGVLVVPTMAAPKVRLDGLMLANPASEKPSPAKLIRCGEPAASSASEIVPTLEPGTVGLKVTEKVQKDAAATLVPQSSVSAKSPATVLLAMVRGALPMLRRIADIGELVVPTSTTLNWSKEGCIETPGSLAGPIFKMKASACPPNKPWTAD